MLSIWPIVVITVVCIGLSAFFSGSEIALLSLSKLALKHMMRDHPRKKHYLEVLLHKPSRYLITILMGNNLANIAAASLATLLVQRIIGGTQGLVVAIVTGAMTFIILVFGEIAPKRYCKQHAEAVSLKVIKSIFLLSSILLPLVKALSFLTQGVLGSSSKQSWERIITEKDIHTLIDIGQEEGVLEEREEELVHSALDFDETQAREIMTPRTKMVAIRQQATLRELAGVITEAGYSRIPVFRDRVDNMVGIAYAKDLLPISIKWDELHVQDIMHTPIFVPYSTRLSETLQLLQRKKTHLAVVVDEYGGVAGIITIEDLVEELVGEIEDEFDKDSMAKIQLLPDGSASIEADTDIDEINETLGTSLPGKQAAFESIGGFLFTQLGRIPRKGETVEHEESIIEVLDVDARRIKKVKISSKKDPGKTGTGSMEQTEH